MVKTQKIMKTVEIEYYVARYFDWRKNIIVPNVSWGMFLYELDLLILNPNGYATEVEIKVSKSDLKADLKKRLCHCEAEEEMLNNPLVDRIKYLYFAIPKKLLDCKDLIPEKAGILVIEEGKFIDYINSYGVQCCKVALERKPTAKSNYQFTMEEKYQIARLGTMRTWKLKEKLLLKD